MRDMKAARYLVVVFAASALTVGLLAACGSSNGSGSSSGSPGAGGSRAGAADQPAGRSRPGAEGGQDPDRACATRKRERLVCR
jgi:hypothetical protein